MSERLVDLTEFVKNHHEPFEKLEKEKTVRVIVFFKSSHSSSFQFNMHSFGSSHKVNFVNNDKSKEELYASVSSYDRAIAEWIDTGGVDSFYSCNFWGIIAEPKVFEHYPVNLTINELSSKDRFELRRRGSIGTGSYFGNFNLQIYADMITTKEITSILRGENELITPRIVGDDGTTTRVAFDLYRFRGAKSDKFEICRIYI